MTVDSTHELDIAVVGAGIAGLSCAWLLSSRHSVTLYEAAPRLGGHTNTISVPHPNGLLAIDTGFIVYNEATYPNLVALFAHLGVATQPSEMSFSVSLDDGALEYGGNDLNSLFAQRSNIFKPRFFGMLRDLLRFYREAPEKLSGLDTMSLGTFLERDGYGRAFRDDHLLPMAAAIWSAPSKVLLDFPAASFVRFCDNHGLLRVRDRPIWRAVRGGSASYLGPLVAPFRDQLRLGRTVVAVTSDGRAATLRDDAGESRRHDHVVLAVHADEALAMIERPSDGRREVLGALRYGDNRAVLHADPSFMPRRRAAWSSWNYAGRRGRADALCVTYWMNRLQSLDVAPDFFVTLNPTREPKGILYDTMYRHPIFDLGALAAQQRLWSLQGEGRIWTCGAYCGSGFHEDALQAGLAVAEAIGGVRRPWRVAAESGRIFLSSEPHAAKQAA